MNHDPVDKLEEPYPQVPIEFSGAGAWEALVLVFLLARVTAVIIHRS